MSNMKNPIVKKTILPFKELKSLAVPYAGNCQADAERVHIVCDCDCVCHCDCDCRCMEDNECHCDCVNSNCDCNCVCDCGALEGDGTLIIPEGIERIYPETYLGQHGIKRVILPHSLKAIGKSAFQDCDALTEVVFQEGVETIEDFAFRRCKSLASVVLPDSLTTLGACAFDTCYDLVSVAFGRSFNGFDPHVFNACNSLASVSVKGGNTHYKAIDGVLYSRCGRTLLFYPGGKRDEIFVLPERVTKIAPCAVFGNDFLAAVEMNEGLKIIGERAFACCNELKNVSLPTTLTEICDSAFGDCRSLKQVQYRGTSRQWSAVKCLRPIFSYRYDTRIVTQ